MSQVTVFRRNAWWVYLAMTSGSLFLVYLGEWPLFIVYVGIMSTLWWIFDALKDLGDFLLKYMATDHPELKEQKSGERFIDKILEEKQS